MTVAQFEAFIDSLELKPWRPQFVVVHNTARPTLAEWHTAPGEVRMRNLADYYRGLGWSGGPHVFVADDLIWLFTPLTSPGVHSPSWNAISWGVEMVGDYDREAFDCGVGALVRENAIGVLSALHRRLGLDPSTLRLHREDPKTTHRCPGRNVHKLDLVAAVQKQMQPGRGMG